MMILVDRQICFRIGDAGPAQLPRGPVRLADAQALALSELLQVFACGEESASLAFAQLGGAPLADAARRGLARIAGEELVHERLLRGLRGALPEPRRDKELRRSLLRFYCGIAQPEIGPHLAAITSLDSAVCSILSALLAGAGALGRDPTVATVFRRIRRDEVGHVRLSRGIAAELARKDVIGAVAERTRLDLVEILARQGAAFERLGVDAERLFARLGRVPDGLFP